MSVSDALRKTRLNPYTLLFLLAGVVAVAYVALGASLLREHLDQGELSSQIESAEAVLATADDVRQNVEELPARVAEAQRELAAAEIAFPSELDSNNIMHTILTLAGEKEVRVLSLDATLPITEPADAAPPAAEPVDAEPADAEPPATEPVEETSGAETLNFDLEVVGDFVQLIAFLEALEKGVASTTRIESLAFQDAEGWYIADIELVAYARSPVAEPSSLGDENQTGEETEAISEGEEAPSE